MAISLLNAQNNNALKEKFEIQNRENNKKFDAYVAKIYGNQRTSEILKEIEEKRMNLAGFTPTGEPYYLEATDFRQVQNSNADFLQNGTITGLSGSFNGEAIKYTVFDGGRAFQGHIFFNNMLDRVSNKEATTMNYSGHATAVTGFIGAKDYSSSGYNYKGIAPNSTFDNYAFATTTLPGNTSTSTINQKILIAQPKISNHSYGVNGGWTLSSLNGSNVWYWGWSYDAGTGASYDLQGAYYKNDRDYDQIVYNNPTYIIVKSSGNYFGDGPNNATTNYAKYYRNSSGTLTEFAATDVLPPDNCVTGNDCIGPGSLAKNIIVVGANDIISTNGNRYVTSSDVVHSSYSSAGPRDDGGIKPDITAVGTNVKHAWTVENTTGSSQSASGSGTSYSSPIVTGIIGLWIQISKSLFDTELHAASAKTLMIHSALEAGNTGPDTWYGWGLIDAKKGAELLVGKSNNTVIFSDETLNSGTPNSKLVKAIGNEPLKVTISWVDPEYTNIGTTYPALHNNRVSKLINDLDLRIIDTTDNTIYYPWKLNINNPSDPATKADNTVDNVEQVVLNTPVSGRIYRIEVTNKGNLVNNAGANASQNYSILITGYNEQVLGTKETTNLSEIAVAPSITKNNVKILKAPAKSTFNIYDTSGKKLQSDVIINDSQQTVELSNYPNGIYIIEIRTDKDTIIKKVIKE